MAFFRGRGRGRGGGGGLRAKQHKFELFPVLQDEENFPKASSVKEERDLVVWSEKLKKFWKSSIYYLENEGEKKEKNAEIERYSDMGKKRVLQKDDLSDIIRCGIDYVPAELVIGSKPGGHARKKVKWNRDLGLETLDQLEKREQNQKGKEDEEKEEEEEEINEEDDGEYSDDGDYNQNHDFDDDEDDFNMPDDNDDEGFF